MDRDIAPLSGGEKRRISLAKLLIDKPDVLLLDEPTNHLDVEAVSWLANHLKNLNDVALVVVTHDRWFLDEVCEEMWEVIRGKVESYEGGYSAFVLAKAERERQGNTENIKRNNLIRKELAWLRRGAPARTAKPKFRIDAANELISAEPAPRDNVELLAFASARLGKTVFELQDADVAIGTNLLISRLDWNVTKGTPTVSAAQILADYHDCPLDHQPHSSSYCGSLRRSQAEYAACAINEVWAPVEPQRAQAPSASCTRVQ